MPRPVVERNVGVRPGGLGVQVVGGPVGVHQGAAPQVLDARTSRGQGRRQRPGLGRSREGVRQGVRGPFERRSEVRRPEGDRGVDVPGPGPGGIGAASGLMEGAACDQAAHRVADQHQAVDRHRPCIDEAVEQLGEQSAVVRDVQPGVVPDEDGSEAEVLLELGSVADVGAAVVPDRVEAPRGVALGQSVKEHDQPRRRRREGLSKRLRFRRHGPAVLCDRHRGGEGRSLTRHHVAVRAVEDREGPPRARVVLHRSPGDPPGRDDRGDGRSQVHRRADRAVGHGRADADGDGDGPGDRAHAREHPTGDARVHLLNARDAAGDRHVRQPAHASRFLRTHRTSRTIGEAH